MPVLVKNLELSIGSFHLGPISTQFADTGIYFIRGQNGAGKTTFLRTLLGRLKSRAGEAEGLSFPIGTVGVESLLMGAWTVRENFEWFSKLLGRTPIMPAEISRLALQRVDHLSAGLKRQMELSLILSLNFKTLFLDEPLSPLDRKQREIYAGKIKEAATKSLILLTTHFEEELFGKPQGILEF